MPVYDGAFSTEKVSVARSGSWRGDEEIELRDVCVSLLAPRCSNIVHLVEKEGRGECLAYYCRTRIGGIIAMNIPSRSSIDEYFSKRSMMEAREAPSSEVVSFLRASRSAGSLAASASVKIFCGCG